MNKFNDSWDNFSRYMMIFDFLIPYREFGSLPGYCATLIEPLRGIGNYTIIFCHLWFEQNPVWGVNVYIINGLKG